MQPATHVPVAVRQMGVGVPPPSASVVRPLQSAVTAQATHAPVPVLQMGVRPVHAVLSVAVHSTHAMLVGLQIVLFMLPTPAGGQVPGIVPVAPGMQPTQAPVWVSQTFAPPAAAAPRQVPAPPSGEQDAIQRLFVGEQTGVAPVQAAMLAGVHCTHALVARLQTPKPIRVQSVSARQQVGPGVGQTPAPPVVLVEPVEPVEPVPEVVDPPVVLPPTVLVFPLVPLVLPPLVLFVLLPPPPRFDDESPPQAATIAIETLAAIASPTCSERI
jgi:hypothetical protein